MTLLSSKKFATVFVLLTLLWTGCQNSTSNEEDSTSTSEEQATDQQEETQEVPTSPADIIPASDVTDSELDNITSAITAMQMIEQGSQMKMMEAVQQSGMEIQRFSEIMQQKQNPDAPLELSAEEQELFDKAEASLKKMQEELQGDYEAAIKENNLTIERYQSIMMAVQTDTSLQRKIDERMRP